MITKDIDLDLRTIAARYDAGGIYILTDINAGKHCLPLVNSVLGVKQDNILMIEAGEEQKTLQTVTQIWDFLIERRATRKSLLLNIGGGVICDMGGFAACCFKRGIDYINIPTTLLSMVDAAIGGKTGIDYKGLKNEIGIINPKAETIVFPTFIRTLPFNQFLSGFAEMLKHALIASPLEVANLLALDIDHPDEDRLAELIARSQDIKAYITDHDPFEQSLRKSLNFGHTVGHALETMALHSEKPMLHGFAVMYGLIAELYLSHIKLGFPKDMLIRLENLMVEYYGRPVCACSKYEELITLMEHDKKNLRAGEINFTLLRTVGNPRINQVCSRDEILQALDYLFSI